MPKKKEELPLYVPQQKNQIGYSDKMESKTGPENVEDRHVESKRTWAFLLQAETNYIKITSPDSGPILFTNREGALDYLRLSGVPIIEADRVIDHAYKFSGMPVRASGIMDEYNTNRYDLREGNSPQEPLDSKAETPTIELPESASKNRGDLVHEKALEIAKYRHGTSSLSELPLEDQWDLLSEAEALVMEKNPYIKMADMGMEQPPAPDAATNTTEWEEIDDGTGKKTWRSKTNPNVKLMRPQGDLEEQENKEPELLRKPLESAPEKKEDIGYNLETRPFTQFSEEYRFYQALLSVLFGMRVPIERVQKIIQSAPIDSLEDLDAVNTALWRIGVEEYGAQRDWLEKEVNRKMRNKKGSLKKTAIPVPFEELPDESFEETLDSPLESEVPKRKFEKLPLVPAVIDIDLLSVEFYEWMYEQPGFRGEADFIRLTWTSDKSIEIESDEPFPSGEGWVWQGVLEPGERFYDEVYHLLKEFNARKYADEEEIFQEEIFQEEDAYQQFYAESGTEVLIKPVAPGLKNSYPLAEVSEGTRTKLLEGAYIGGLDVVTTEAGDVYAFQLEKI